MSELEIVVNWRDVAAYALGFAGAMLVLFVTIAAGFAKWGVTQVLRAIETTNKRLTAMEDHVEKRMLGFDRRVTRIEAKVGLSTPMPLEDREYTRDPMRPE